MGFDDVIEYDGDGRPDPPPARKPTEDLILYLQTLFRPEDHVGYVTGDAWQNADGKWVPGKGVYNRTAGELIASLQKYPDDLGATVGDWKPEAGSRRVDSLQRPGRQRGVERKRDRLPVCPGGIG